MIEIKVDRPPRTAMEVFNMLPEGTLCEVIENQLYMAPPPNEPHQRTLIHLVVKLESYVQQHQLGETRVALYGVYLDNENVIEPDILFISNEKLDHIKKNGFHGVPDLIIEILSPSNEKYDSLIKKRLCERFAVKEFWIVNPETREATGFQWNNGKYTEMYHGMGQIKSQLLNYTFSF